MSATVAIRPSAWSSESHQTRRAASSRRVRVSA